MSGLGQSIADNAILSKLIELVQKGVLALKDAAAEVGMSEADFSKLLDSQNK